MRSCTIWFLLLLATFANAQTFNIEDPRDLTVTWGDRPLIAGDSINYFDPQLFADAQGLRSEQVGDWQVHNVWHAPANQTPIARREIATTGDEVELTVQFRLPAYSEDPDNPTIAYGFNVPAATLEGMRYRAIIGRGHGPKEQEGVLTASTPDGGLLSGGTRFIAFEGDDGRGIIFDLQPKGVIGYADYGPTVLQGYWSVAKQGDKIRFSFGGSPRLYGGTWNSQVRIIEGTFADHDRLHAHYEYSYYSELDTIRRMSFGAAGAAEGWTQVDGQAYTAERGCGWIDDITGAQLTGDGQADPLHGYAHGDTLRRMRIDVPQPGIYIITMRTALPNDSNARGPFTVTCDGMAVAEAIHVEPGELKTLTFARYTTDRDITIGFEDDWAVSTLAIQPLLYATEDYAFTRGVWLSEDVPTPTAIQSYPSSMPPREAVVQTESWITEPPTDEQVAAATLPPGEVLLPDQGSPDLAWRWSSVIAGLGPSNNGSFLEFDTDAEISRRLDDLVGSGIRTVLVNGLLMRHAHEHQLPRVKRTLRRITQLAHERGMKVLDHQDLTVLPYREQGYNLLVNQLAWMQRDVRTGVITRGYCPNNPEHRARYQAYMCDWVEQTGIDGFMIDETTFHGEMFCGCQYCREKFYQDTGLRLPNDPTSDVLLAGDSRLWKLWQSWRMKSVVDWWVDLRRAVREVNPNIVMMKYTTHYGFTSRYASCGFGMDLIKLARGADFLGTEIMSRNVLASYRGVYAYRSMKSALNTAFGSPVFGLVYPIGVPEFAYAGWAMNNMHGQVTWSTVGDKLIEDDAKRYTDWPDNMDKQHAKLVADVALVFSDTSRDFPKMMGHPADLRGATQMLADMHVPYGVILQRQLTVEDLRNYRLLILPSACSLSDQHIAAVRAYLEQGGRVMITAHSGMLDEVGERREVWPIGQWLGMRAHTSLLKPGTLSGSLVDEPFDYDHGFVRLLPEAKEPTSTVLAQVQSGNVTAPVIVEANIGDGYLIYCAAQLGQTNSESETTIDREWTYEPHPKVTALFGAMVERALDGPATVTAPRVPAAVRMSVFRDGDTVAVHLFNGTGVQMKVGQKVPRTAPEPAFPLLDADVVFDIALPDMANPTGYIASPDYEGRRPIDIAPQGEGRFRVTVAREDFQAYAIVWLK
jgi:hypothetical protein